MGCCVKANASKEIRTRNHRHVGLEKIFRQVHEPLLCILVPLCIYF